MRFFYFLARNISYTFALSFLTVAVGIFLAVFSFILGSSFIVVSYGTITEQLLPILPMAVMIPSFLHYIHFGFFTPIQIPAFFKAHRIINSAFKRDLDIPEDELDHVYGFFSDLPMYNMLISAFYSAIAGFIIVGFTFYQYWFAGSYSLDQLYAILRITIISIIITMVFYGMSSYLLTEALTNNERSRLYNDLLKRGHRIKPRALIGIRIKFLFFVWLMIITLLTFAAIMEKARFFEEYRLEIIIGYFVVSVLASFFLMQVTTRSILLIVSDIIRVTKAISSGGRAGFQVLPLEREFAAIEFALMDMAWEIDEYRTDIEDKVDKRTEELQDALTSLQGRDDQIQKQLDMASVIQRSILPGRIDDWNELKFAVRYIAMEKIGGDFYDVYMLKEEKLGIIIADVSGHGIPAALVTTMAKMSFGNAGTKFDSPRKIFQEVNQNILDHVKTQDYMTCFMLVIDDEYNVVYSNASHQKAILLRSNAAEVDLLDTNGLFIGALEDARDTYDEKKTELQYGDRIILYTDGIPEAINENREEYSNKRLEEIIISNRDKPIEEFADTILKDVRNFIGNAQVVDDITFMVIELARDEAIEIIKNSKKLINSHKYHEAVALLEKGLQKYPDNQKIMYNLSKNYFRVNNYKMAVEILDRYIEHDKRNKNAYYIGGAACFQMNDYANAIDYFEKALELDMNFINAHFALGMTFKKKGDAENARKSFERVINIDPDNRMALFELKSLKQELPT